MPATAPTSDPLALAARHRARVAALRADAPGVRRGTVSADIAEALMQVARLETLAVDQALQRMLEAAAAAHEIARQVEDARRAPIARLARRIAALRSSEETTP